MTTGFGIRPVLYSLLFATFACTPVIGGEQTTTPTPPDNPDDTGTAAAPASTTPSTTEPEVVNPCPEPPEFGLWREHPIFESSINIDASIANIEVTPSGSSGLDVVRQEALASGKGAGSYSINDEAVVVAMGTITDAHPDKINIWLADATGVMMGRMDFSKSVEFSVGERVSFEVYGFALEDGMPMFTHTRDLFINTDPHPVHVTDLTDGSMIDYGDSIYTNDHVETWGALIEERPCPVGEAGDGLPVCFNMLYGDGNAVVFRSAGVVSAGDCVHYIGPVTQYGGETHLDAERDEWFRVY